MSRFRLIEAATTFDSEGFNHGPRIPFLRGTKSANTHLKRRLIESCED